MESLKRLQQRMPAGIDAAILFSEINRSYFTGFAATDGILFVTREKACLIMDSRYIEAAKAEASDCEVVLLENRKEQLSRLVKENGVQTAAVETYNLPVAEFEKLKAELPKVRFDHSNALSDVIVRLRMVKTPEEIENIRRSQAITDAAFEHILPFIKPGVRERDLALEIEYFMKKQGASGPSFDLIAISGENTSKPHGVPGMRKIQNGDFVTMDTGAIFHGGCSDMTRTVAVGGVTSAMRHVYDTVLKAQLACEEMIRAGVVCKAVDKTARDIIYGAGYEGCFGHGLGHSLGREIHEYPFCNRSCEEVLAPGMFMTVEPGVYLEGRFGVRIEDLVLVTKTGCEILTKSPKELMIL